MSQTPTGGAYAPVWETLTWTMQRDGIRGGETGKLVTGFLASRNSQSTCQNYWSLDKCFQNPIRTPYQSRTFFRLKKFGPTFYIASLAIRKRAPKVRAQNFELKLGQNQLKYCLKA